jgi:hypothetical protein
MGMNMIDMIYMAFKEAYKPFFCMYYKKIEANGQILLRL